MKFAIKIIKVLSALLNVGLFCLVIYFMLKSQQEPEVGYSYLLNICLLLFVAAVLISALVFIFYDATAYEKKNKSSLNAINNYAIPNLSELSEKISSASEDVIMVISNNLQDLNKKIETAQKNKEKSLPIDFDKQSKLLKDINERIETIAQRQDALNKNFNVVLKVLDGFRNKKGGVYAKTPEDIKYPEATLKMKVKPTNSTEFSEKMPSAEEKQSLIKPSERKSSDDENANSISKEEAQKQLKKIFNDEFAAQMADLDILKDEKVNESTVDYEDADLDEFLDEKMK